MEPFFHLSVERVSPDRCDKIGEYVSNLRIVRRIEKM